MEQNDVVEEINFPKLTEKEAEDLGKVIIELSERGFKGVLSSEEEAAYREAQQSVIDARNSAPLNEGNIYIS